MVSKKEMSKINRMAQIIKQTGGIHKWDLIDEAKLSINKYNQLQSYMKYKMAETIKYDKDTEAWFPVHVEPTKTVKKMEREITLDDER